MAAYGNALVHVTVKASYKKLAKELDRQEKAFPRAVAAACNRCGDMIKSRAVKGISRQAQVTPARLIRERLKVKRARLRNMSAAVRYRYIRMPAEILGRKRGQRIGAVQTKTGVRAGSQFFPKAFIATPTYGRNKGKPGVYYRVTKRNYPIDRQYVMLDVYKMLCKTVGDRVCKSHLDARLTYELKRRGINVG